MHFDPRRCIQPGRRGLGARAAKLDRRHGRRSLGARVGGAAVALLHDDQVAQDTKSDAQGQFTFDRLAEGRYRIQVTADGFQVRTTGLMFLAAGARTTLEVSLPLGPLETAVTVTAAADAVLPSQIGAAVTVLDAKTLEAVGKPDVLEALRLVPGSSLVQTGARGGTTSIFIRGGNSNFNKLVIDGITANDIGGGIDLSQFSMPASSGSRSFEKPTA